MSILLVFCFLLACNPSLNAQANCNFAAGNYNPCNYDTANIIQEMIHPHNNLVMLAAHRGAHNTINPAIVNTVLAPENSLESIGATALLGYEMAEVDIKMSADNVPMLSHDTTLGREALCPTCDGTGSNFFDPFFTNTPAHQALNPLVSSLTEAQAKQYTLWTVQNPSAHRAPVASLLDLLNYMTTNKIAMVIAIDVKDIPAALACWHVIKANTDYLGRSYSKSVVFKMGAQVFGATPVQFESTFGADYPNVLYWPYYTTNMIAPIGNNFGSEASMIAALQSWQASNVQLVGSEVNIKQDNGILTQMLEAAKLYNGVSTTSVGSFSPTAESLTPGDTTPEFFYGKDSPNSTPPTFSGYCCYKLSDILFNGSPYNEPSDTQDQRGDFVNFLAPKGISVITTDEITSYDETLKAMNLRHTEWLQNSFQGDPHCNVLNGKYPGCDSDGATVYTLCAAEGGTCNFTGVRNVAFGANGVYNYKTFVNSAACDISTLGPDPVSGVVKACYYGPAIGSPLGQFGQPSVYCADENGSCNFNGTAIGIFGAGGTYTSIGGKQNSFACNASSFGNRDPFTGVAKTCFYQLSSGNLFGGPPDSVLCANENQTCQFAGAAKIAFGANGNFSYRTFTASSPESQAGGATCNTSVFGDPSNGVAKSCYYLYAIPTSSMGSSGSTGSTGSSGDPGSTDSNGTLIAQQIADPAYFYPGPLWTQLDQTRPTVGIAVANVSNGPDYIVNPDYVTAIQNAHNAGIKVLGYVDTGYFGGTTPARTTRLGQTDAASWTSQIEQDVNTWYSLYGSSIDGIFFDDGQNVCGTNNQYVQLYGDISDYVKQNHPGAHTVMNAGTNVPECLKDTADTILTFENDYLCYINDPSCPGGAGYVPLTWTADPQKIWHAIYNVPASALANASALSKQRNAGFVFMTSNTLAQNPYGNLPPYFSQEAATAVAGGVADTVAPTAPTALQATLIQGAEVVLTWAISTDQGSGVVAYDIYQNGIKVLSMPAAQNEEWGMTGLMPSTQYTFSVKARDGAGNVSLASTLNVTTAAGGSAVAARSASVTKTNYTDVQLQWGAFLGEQFTVQYYDIYVNATKVMTVDGSVTNADVVGLTPATTYTAWVQARDSNGNISPTSNTLFFTTSSYPSGGAVTNVSYQLNSNSIAFSATYLAPFGFHHIFFDFDANSATGYQFGWTTPALGADYLIENNQLLTYTGDGTSFSWLPVATVTPVITGSPAVGLTYTWTVPFSALPNPVTISRFMAHGTGYAPEAYGSVIQTSTAVQ
jgi:glycerophosphoryl diester phosphodiesterase/chitodextrinase